MVVSFDLGSAERAPSASSRGAELVTDATSFGSVHTVAERRARWGGDAVPEGFIRFGRLRGHRGPARGRGAGARRRGVVTAS